MRQEDVYALMAMQGINDQAVDQVCLPDGPRCSCYHMPNERLILRRRLSLRYTIPSYASSSPALPSAPLPPAALSALADTPS